MWTEEDLVASLCAIHKFLRDEARAGDEWSAEFFGEGVWAQLVPNKIRKSLNLSPDWEE
jgi:hypothetical protein